MKPQGDIVAERPLASHADELIKPRAAAPGLEQTSRFFAVALARKLRDALSSLMGGAHFSVELSAPEQAEAGVIFAQFKPPAASALIAGIPGLPNVFASVTRHDTLALCDRAYGGIGSVHEEAETTGDLPVSASLMLDRLGRALCGALGEVAGVKDGVHVANRAASLERLATFGSRADTLSFSIIITEEGREPWTIKLMALAKGFAAFLAALDRPHDDVSSKPVPTGPNDEPFSGIPLPLRAVLAEMRVSAMRVSDLAPGDMLPVTLRREVPLLVRNNELARGTVGTTDDRIALKLTRIASEKGHIR